MGIKRQSRSFICLSPESGSSQFVSHSSLASGGGGGGEAFMLTESAQNRRVMFRTV